jgi:hypothetical protein
MDDSATRNRRPPGTTGETVAALGLLSEALEAADVARGQLYQFHRLTGKSDAILQEAVAAFRKAGHSDLADVLDRHMVGRNVLEGRWTFQIVEEYDDNYYFLFRSLEHQAREELVDGRRHIHEAEMKDAESHGESGRQSYSRDCLTWVAEMAPCPRSQ